MKIYNYILIIIVALSLSSCEDYFGDVNNLDPDNPTSVTPNVILPVVQARLSYTVGGDFTRYVGLNTQHVDGISRQFAVLGNYGINGTDTDNSWSNVYTGILGSNRALLDLARENGLNHYAGIALAIEAYTMLLTTDMFGDVPYSDAFKFGTQGVYAPTFDSQESIYTAINGVLDEAIVLLGSESGGASPGSDDFIYGGNIGNWISFCNVVKARAAIHLTKVPGNTAYADAMAALANGFTSSADDAGFQYGLAATENAPWYQYVEQRDDCETGGTYTDLLGSFNDPRTATYGQPHTNDHPIWTKDQNVKLITFTEQEFIKAEAMLSSNPDGAYAAYLSGIGSSLAEAQVSDGDAMTYLATAKVAVGAGSLTLKDIMTQKYLALYTDPEVFNDWRRTGIPALTPNTGTEIPRRLPYAQTEILSNPNTPSPANVNIYTRVWWDQ